MAIVVNLINPVYTDVLSNGWRPMYRTKNIIQEKNKEYKSNTEQIDIPISETMK